MVGFPEEGGVWARNAISSMPGEKPIVAGECEEEEEEEVGIKGGKKWFCPSLPSSSSGAVTARNPSFSSSDCENDRGGDRLREWRSVDALDCRLHARLSEECPLLDPVINGWDSLRGSILSEKAEGVEVT